MPVLYRFFPGLDERLAFLLHLLRIESTPMWRVLIRARLDASGDARTGERAPE